MLSDVLSYMNTTFTLFFTIESILKLISFGCRVTLAFVFVPLNVQVQTHVLARVVNYSACSSSTTD